VRGLFSKIHSNHLGKDRMKKKGTRKSQSNKELRNPSLVQRKTYVVVSRQQCYETEGKPDIFKEKIEKVQNLGKTTSPRTGKVFSLSKRRKWKRS